MFKVGDYCKLRDPDKNGLPYGKDSYHIFMIDELNNAFCKIRSLRSSREYDPGNGYLKTEFIPVSALEIIKWKNKNQK